MMGIVRWFKTRWEYEQDDLTDAAVIMLGALAAFALGCVLLYSRSLPLGG